jgi:hypothetical protein
MTLTSPDPVACYERVLGSCLIFLHNPVWARDGV